MSEMYRERKWHKLTEVVTKTTLSLLLQRTYIFTFLLSSRLFMHPYELMAKVCHLCVEHQRLSEGDSDKVTQHLNFMGFVVIVVVLGFLWICYLWLRFHGDGFQK